jgi:tetratricopeptide (TPR) repeat protein
MAEANELMQQERSAEALGPLARAIKACPTNYKAFGNQGVCLMMAGRWQEAEKSLRQATALRADYAIAWENLGVALTRLGRDEEALTAVLRAVELSPALPNAPLIASRILIDLKRMDEAIRVLDGALAQDPRNGKALAKRALALHEKGDPAAAETAYRKALEANPSDHEGTNNFGTLLEEQGRLVEAEQLYKKAMTLLPTYQPALRNLSRLRQMPMTKERLAVSLRDVLLKTARICGELATEVVTEDAALRARGEHLGRELMERFRQAVQAKQVNGSDLVQLFRFAYCAGVNDAWLGFSGVPAEQWPALALDRLFHEGASLEGVPSENAEPVLASAIHVTLFNALSGWLTANRASQEQTGVSLPELTRHALFWTYLVGATRPSPASGTRRV